MKPRFLIYFLVLILVMLAVWLLQRPHQRTVESTPVISASIQTNHSPNSVLVSNAVAATQNSSTDSVAISAKPGSKFDFLKQPEMLLQYDKTHIVPIEFYGLVIDQNSNPVPDAKIDTTVLQLHANPSAPLWTEEKQIPMKAETDEDGHFMIQGMKGSSLHIDSVQKDGYRLSPKTKSLYVYYATSIEPFHPDPQNPVVIKMWKMIGKGESLITGYHVFGIDLGKTYTLDLLQGKKYIGETVGDLQISITRPDQVKSGDKYPWSFSLQAIGGGLIEAATDDEFMYLAPETGYEPNFSMEFDPTNADWKPEISKQFFISTRNGRVYGRVAGCCPVIPRRWCTGLITVAAANMQRAPFWNNVLYTAFGFTR